LENNAITETAYSALGRAQLHSGEGHTRPVEPPKKIKRRESFFEFSVSAE